MDNPVRGICLAILNGTFGGKKDFEIDIDRQTISKTFEELQFECHIHENLGAEDMLNVIKETAALDHSKYNALVVLASSHGLKDRVLGTDWKAVSFNKIIRCFTSIECQTLAYKPKLFLFDVCRGQKIMDGLFQKSSLAVPPGNSSSEGAVAPDTSERSSFFEN